MTRRLVVTGVDGFVGRHLARVAAQSGFEVFGISRNAQPDAEALASLTGYASADLRRGWPVGVPLDADVVHLAGLAAVGPSFDSPQEYIDGNSAMVTSMCEALLSAGFTGRVVGVSTGAVYAQEEEVARIETDPVAYTSPYVVSKVLTENQLAYYARRGLRTVVARPFNHIGPNQGPGFLLPDLLRQHLASAPERPLRVGNLDTRRDYTDVRDVARAYLALATAPRLAHDVYNVASGTARSGREILEALYEALGQPVPPLEVDDSRIRVTDPALIVGNSSRLRSDTGWFPAVSFRSTIADTVAAGL
ncbi:NAD-dependent epimerase/dehydratase family protein [Microbacterium sp. VKM Ac-2870]|uniref:NAD-dependent epimerase/dehydratase family protein n=1 Tax=Microbacterium sp. VKM Ac-2870 TaxID=2783825 RepID=UPI00188D21A2|nr:NAD-dependent epimerase/dehydratase family protein [Microbacterium sp. VKM Ac-2870]MBF4561683.1 NAD-dependent epimerase/dehydratase family protein [Microbacterium sp. VKM Ac-2870]